MPAPNKKSKKQEAVSSKRKTEKSAPVNRNRTGSKPIKKRSFNRKDEIVVGAERKDNDVYEYDGDELTESQKRDELRRFAGVDVYDYEQPEDFANDEEIDEDAAFDEEDYDRFGDIGKQKKKDR